MFRKKYTSEAEIERLIHGNDNEEEDIMLIHDADTVDFALLPPRRVDELTDEENTDENEQILNDSSIFVPADVAGAKEVQCEFNDCNEKLPHRVDSHDEDYAGGDEEDDYEPVNETNRKQRERKKPKRCTPLL